MRRDRVKATSNVTIEVARHGVVRSRQTHHNLVMTAGKATMLNRLIALPTTVFNVMKLGTGATAASAGQTDLVAFITDSNKECDTVEMSEVQVVEFEHTWLAADFAETGICEAGIFDDIEEGEGTMLARVTFDPVDKTLDDTLKITWTIEIP